VTNTHAAVEKVFELFRRANHYSLLKTQPNLFNVILNQIKDVRFDIVELALKEYEAGLKAGKKLHPNYFLRIVLTKNNTRLQDDEIKPIWGKSI
jgi:hypothetical protein